MPAAMTVRKICETALMDIGSFSMADEAADPDEMERAARYLDMIVGHLTGTIRALWLTEKTVPIPLTADKINYTELELQTAAGVAVWPERGIQFPNHATVASGGFDHPCEIIDRVTYDAIEDKDAAGRPCVIYIDRRADPLLFVYPVPGDASFTLNLTGQTFHRNLIGTRNTPETLEIGTDLKEAWNLWAVAALAAKIGDGPVRKLDVVTIRDKKKEARMLLEELESYENQEHDGESIRVGFRDPAYG